MTHLSTISIHLHPTGVRKTVLTSYRSLSAMVRYQKVLKNKNMLYIKGIFSKISSWNWIPFKSVCLSSFCFFLFLRKLVYSLVDEDGTGPALRVQRISNTFDILYTALCVEIKVDFYEERVYIFFLKSQMTCHTEILCTVSLEGQGNPAFWVQKGQHMKWVSAHSEPCLVPGFWALALPRIYSLLQPRVK